MTAVSKLQWGLAALVVIVALLTRGGWGDKTDDPDMKEKDSQ